MRADRSFPRVPVAAWSAALVFCAGGCKGDEADGGSADGGDPPGAGDVTGEGEGEGPEGGDGGGGGGEEGEGDGSGDGGEDDGICPIHRKPACNQQAEPPVVPYRPGQGCRADEQCADDAPGTTCDRSVGQCRDDQGCLLPWECYECPRDPEIRCPGALVPLKDKYGCVSAESECGCQFTEAPDCPPGQFPHQVCAEDGTRCFTGGCGPTQCPCIVEPRCEREQVAERDEGGCLTGRCTSPACPDIQRPTCECGNRPARSREGCLLGPCELEPLPCDAIDVPVCPNGQVPGLTSLGQSCLTGDCVVGLCVNTCATDRQCASSDACLPYAGGCNVCQPRPCDDDMDCPERTDCVAGRCRLRQVPDARCDDGDACDGGLVCDDPGCGRCAPPCACRTHRDCPDGFRCRECACIEGCRDDGDCDRDLRCDPEMGECRGCSCENDGDCEQGRYCDCFCRSGCRNSDECPPWRVCSLESRECVPEIQCQADQQCGRNEICVDSRCVRNHGVCEDGAEACAAEWDWRVQDWGCRKDTNPVPACPPDRGPDCDPRDDNPRPACLCELDECLAAPCDGPAHEPCPAGAYHCSKRDPGNPQDAGVCRAGRPEERRLCRVDADCVPEACDVPTFCVHHDANACETRITPGTEAGRDEIVACTCEDDVCRTHYQ